MDEGWYVEQIFRGIFSYIGTEKNRKRDVNSYYRRQDNRNRNDLNAPPGRGDIPIIHGDCDGKLNDRNS